VVHARRVEANYSSAQVDSGVSAMLVSTVPIGAVLSVVDIGLLINDAVRSGRGTRSGRGYAFAEVVLGFVGVANGVVQTAVGGALHSSYYSCTSGCSSVTPAMLWGLGIGYILLSAGVLAHGGYLLATAASVGERKATSTHLFPVVVGDSRSSGPGLALIGRF
jgi:hypothetical protein